MNEKQSLISVVFANLISAAVIALVVFLFRDRLDAYAKTLVPPNITVKPSEVEVVFPKDFGHNHLEKLTYFELSQLIDCDMTAFLRMANHYKTNPSEKLKLAIVEQGKRLETVLAFREQAWISEGRQLGLQQNDFSPMKTIIDDVLKSLSPEANDGPAPGEVPKAN